MQITEVAAQLMARAEQRAEIAAQNIANASTPGYRRRVAFAEMLAAAPGAGAATQLSSAADFSAGQLVRTDSPTDLGIAGEGFFAVRSGEATLYTRQGQFRRDAEGRLATAQGMVLQSAEGGDVTVGDAPFEVAADGTVTRDGIPLARIALVAFDETGLLAPAGNGAFAAGDLASRPAEAAMVRQGMLETSNVNMGDEMVAMMEAVRRAETGQRLVTTYDDLMGRALNLFGQQ
jgi:flagellar basal-body rod protein FlgG